MSSLFPKNMNESVILALEEIRFMNRKFKSLFWIPC